MPAQFLIVANPTSGRRRAHALAQEVLALLRAAGQTAEWALTSARGDARKLAAEAAAEGTATVVGCGGDGTLQEIASALAGTSCVMGILPGGRCNDLASALDIHRQESPAQLAATLLSGRVRPIDLGSYEGPGQAASVLPRYFCTVATLGFDSQVTRFVLTHRFPFKGTPEYLYGILREILRFKPPRVKLKGDFGEFDGKIVLAATGNTPTYGGAMRIAPDAQLDDGYFDLCLVEAVSRSTMLRILPKVFRGQHVTHPAVRMFRTRSLSIETPDGPQWICADGEPMGETPAHLEVKSHVLRVKVKG